MAIITTNLFDDDCLRLKICSLNRKDLRLIPVEFTLGWIWCQGGPILVKNGFRISTKIFDAGQSWQPPIMPRISSIKKVRQLTFSEIEFLRMLAYWNLVNYVAFKSSRRAKIVHGLVFVQFLSFCSLFLGNY